MNILHVVPSYLPATRYGGPIFSVHNLCKSLVARGHKVTVFTTNVDGRENSQVKINCAVDLDGVEVWYFPSRLLRRLYWSPLLLQALKESIRDFDIVHTHSIFLWPTLVAARVASKNNKPYVVSPRGMLVKELFRSKNFFLKYLWYRTFEKKTLENAAAVHVTSNREKEDIRAFNLKIARYALIPNIAAELSDEHKGDLVRFKSLVVCNNLILFLGRISWKKGLDRLVRALAKVPEATLCIAGGDDEGYRFVIEEMIRGYGINDRVNFVGEVGQKEKTYLMENAKLLVLTSYNENFGNVVAEAMSAALPVVVTEEVGISDTVTLAGAGIVTTGSDEQIANAISYLLKNNDIRIGMGKKGQQYVSSHFSDEAVGAATEILYKTLCGGHNNRA